jgi:hypothetical protein
MSLNIVSGTCRLARYVNLYLFTSELTTFFVTFLIEQKISPSTTCADTNSLTATSAVDFIIVPRSFFRTE